MSIQEQFLANLVRELPFFSIVDEFFDGSMGKQCQMMLGSTNPMCKFLTLFKTINDSTTNAIFCSPLVFHIFLCLYPLRHLKMIKM